MESETEEPEVKVGSTLPRSDERCLARRRFRATQQAASIAAATIPLLMSANIVASPCAPGLFGRPAVSSSISIEGSSSTVMPSCAEAAAAVPRLVESRSCIAVAVVKAGTAMLAVIRTEPAATLISTAAVSTAATVAMLCCKLEVSA